MTVVTVPLLGLALALQPLALQSEALAQAVRAPATTRPAPAAVPAPVQRPVAAQPPAPRSFATFLLDGRPLQQLQLEQITYLGDCPGEELREIRGVSFLAAAPPAPYQRIVIQNLSTGGFTDREYDERRSSSQTFSVAPGMGQRGSVLTLAPGPNSFSYVVRQRLQNVTVDQGSAVLPVSVNRLNLNRTFEEVREEAYCSGEKNRSPRTPLERCAGGLITLERIGICPGGRSTTLSLETLGSGYQPGTRPGGGANWNGGGGGWNGGGSWGGGGWNGRPPQPQPR